MTNKLNPVRVMLVDDTFHFRVRMAALLSVLPGVEVVGQAEDVPSGLVLFEDLQPDVVLLDISLPGPSGIQLLEVIKQQRPQTVVINNCATAVSNWARIITFPNQKNMNGHSMFVNAWSNAGLNPK